MNTERHVVVWLDRPGGSRGLGSGHTEALSLAASSCKSMGGTVTGVTALAVGEDLDGHFADECGRYGARRVILLRMDGALADSPEAPATAFLWALGQPGFGDRPVTDIVATANAAGRDFMARVASALAAPLLQDCVAVDFGAGVGEKYILQGRTRGVYSLPGPVNCWTLRPHAYAAHEAEGGIPQPADVDEMTPPVIRPRVRPSASGRSCDKSGDIVARMWDEQPDITEAAVIISGGRSLASAENFRLLHETAAPLHAAVGASRSAVDVGYAPPFVQVGQTGVVVSPELYIACGISGSIFHTTGIKGARTVVAVNTDRSAQIFLRADYGITDDLFVVLPLLRKEFEQR